MTAAALEEAHISESCALHSLDNVSDTVGTIVENRHARNLEFKKFHDTDPAEADSFIPIITEATPVPSDFWSRQNVPIKKKPFNFITGSRTDSRASTSRQSSNQDCRSANNTRRRSFLKSQPANIQPRYQSQHSLADVATVVMKSQKSSGIFKRHPNFYKMLMNSIREAAHDALFKKEVTDVITEKERILERKSALLNLDKQEREYYQNLKKKLKNQEYIVEPDGTVIILQSKKKNDQKQSSIRPATTPGNVQVSVNEHRRFRRRGARRPTTSEASSKTPPPTFIPQRPSPQKESIDRIKLKTGVKATMGDIVKTGGATMGNQEEDQQLFQLPELEQPKPTPRRSKAVVVPKRNLSPRRPVSPEPRKPRSRTYSAPRRRTSYSGIIGRTDTREISASKAVEELERRRENVSLCTEF